MMALSRDFSEFLIALNDQGVEYLLVGGYAQARDRTITGSGGSRPSALRQRGTIM